MRKLRKRRELHSLNPSFLRASSDRSDKVNVYIRGSIKVNYPALSIVAVAMMFHCQRRVGKHILSIAPPGIPSLRGISSEPCNSREPDARAAEDGGLTPMC